MNIGCAPLLADRSTVFLWGITLGLPAALIYRSLAFYSASINQTRPIMVLSFVGLATNAVLNWILIYGHFGFPAMGGAGCGWATGIGMWVALIAMTAWTALAPVYRPYYLWRSWTLPDWNAQKRLLRIGLPMGGAALAEVTAFSSVAVLVGRFGEVQIAAHQIGLNFASLVFMLPMGLSSALTIRVGQALGAGDAVAARQMAWFGLGLSMLIAAFMIGPIILLRDEVAAIYSSDLDVRALSANLFGASRSSCATRKNPRLLRFLPIPTACQASSLQGAMAQRWRGVHNGHTISATAMKIMLRPSAPTSFSVGSRGFDLIGFDLPQQPGCGEDDSAPTCVGASAD